jgi:hypothetical protein
MEFPMKILMQPRPTLAAEVGGVVEAPWNTATEPISDAIRFQSLDQSRVLSDYGLWAELMLRLG